MCHAHMVKPVSFEKKRPALTNVLARPSPSPEEAPGHRGRVEQDRPSGLSETPLSHSCRPIGGICSKFHCVRAQADQIALLPAAAVVCRSEKQNPGSPDSFVLCSAFDLEAFGGSTAKSVCWAVFSIIQCLGADVPSGRRLAFAVVHRKAMQSPCSPWLRALSQTAWLNIPRFSASRLEHVWYAHELCAIDSCVMSLVRLRFLLLRLARCFR